MRVNVDTLRQEASRFEKPQSKRESAILDAAMRIFGEKGYKAARTADIAAAAGVTERTLFRYFPTKEALYHRVTAPALLEVAYPRALTDTGKLFVSNSESFVEWERRILETRLAAVRQSAPQFQLLLATLVLDAKTRRKVIALWQEKLWEGAIVAVRRFQERGEVRADLAPEAIVRVLISLNVSYIVARALLAPDAEWNDEAEVAATIDVLMNGVKPR